MAPTLARKIMDSQFLKLYNDFLTSYSTEPNNLNELIFIESLQLIYNIIGEVPNLLNQFVDSGLLENILQILSKKDLPSESKKISQIVYFLNQSSLKE
jgi:hypothetical protein